MDGRRRPKWDNYRRSQNKRAPRCLGNWQPTVPSWEKRFCKVVGLMDWEELLQQQKFMHLYENVVNWNDSAGEEALFNAKKRFWAEMNGLSCDLRLPDPNLYIDEINWESSEIEAELQADLESEQPLICNTEEYHEPVVIFGDSLISNQGYSTTGWGDDNNEQFPANSSPNNNHVDPWEHNWGDSVNKAGNSGWPDYSYSKNNYNAGYVMCGVGWNGDWGGQSYANNNNFNHEGASYGEDYRAAGGWNDGWGQSYVNNNFNYKVGDGREDKRAYGGGGAWNNSKATRNNGGRHASRYNKQWPVVGSINR